MTEPPADLTAELVVAVRQLNETMSDFRPRVDAAVKSQMRLARRVLVGIALAAFLCVGSVGCVLWQRQNQANHERIAACRANNDARAVSRTAWAVVWDALDRAATSDQRTQIDAIRVAQRSANGPIPCK